ncbi:hypothetical protein [Anatilimnocola floriformis]|uniref:hypothetical protein n=1 Tax=Anatilimnocola floriformis TaxID=2948575 RepID=UPI0020C36350|nr:hypothetical protein [Anatilimnocola floriformis]
MTVIACRECHQPVSTEAPACPHCGCPTDPKPVHKSSRGPQSSLGKDPRCYLCGGSANRACSRCGQFCCGAHIGAPSNYSSALCTGCDRTRQKFLFWTLAFVAVIIGSFCALKAYESFNPVAKLKASDVLPIRREIEKQQREMWENKRRP